MFKHTTVKKSLILLVAALLCVAVFLAACSEKPFTSSFTAPTGETVDSNGGLAVRYGDYIYYVNGYASDVNAANTYVDVKDAPRVGSVVRIHKDKIAAAIAISEDKDKTSTQKAEEIADLVRENAKTVVPKIYFTANATNAQNNGIYIFNDRLYILTPNEKLTANGDKLTNQSVLMSFDLAGGNMQRHFTFANNSVQLWFTEAENKQLFVTYLDGSELHVLELGADEKSTKDVAIKTDGETDTSITSVNHDVAGKCLFFIDGNGSVCKLALGKTEQEVLVNNAVADDKDESTFSYTIKSVSNGYVYFTRADSDNPDVDNLVLYYASSADKVAEVGGEAKVALDNAQNLTVYGWRENSVVYMGSKSNQSGSYTGYGIWIISSRDGANPTSVLLPGWSKESITINKIEGDVLYFTAGGVTYTKNLAEFVGANAEGSAQELGTPYATGWSNSPSVGWATPDVVELDGHVYMFTLGTGSVSVVEFDAVKKVNGASTALTLTAKADEDK